MGWEKKSAQKINFEVEGMVVEGRIIAIQDTELKVKNYTLSQEDGGLITFLGTTVLDRLIADEMGQLVRLTYLGTAPTSRGFKVKQFDVEVWRDEEEPEAEADPKGKKGKAESDTPF